MPSLQYFEFNSRSSKIFSGSSPYNATYASVSFLHPFRYKHASRKASPPPAVLTASAKDSLCKLEQHSLFPSASCSMKSTVGLDFFMSKSVLTSLEVEFISFADGSCSVVCSVVWVWSSDLLVSWSILVSGSVSLVVSGGVVLGIVC